MAQKRSEVFRKTKNICNIKLIKKIIFKIFQDVLKSISYFSKINLMLLQPTYSYRDGRIKGGNGLNGFNFWERLEKRKIMTK